MGNRDRYERHRLAQENAGKPLGGGLDPAPAPVSGSASLFDVAVRKPVEQGGATGLAVGFRLRTEKLGRARLVLEVTLHEQGRDQLSSRMPAFADALGKLGTYEVFVPADDDAVEGEHRAFFPFAAIEVEREGLLRCFARVRVLEPERGLLAENEAAFDLTAG